MEAKHIERLEQGVRVLRELPPEKRFDLSCWNICGTVGCAVGWMATDGWFRRRGFKLRRDGIISCYNTRRLGVEIGATKYVPVCGQWLEFRAVAHFFGITGGDAEYLFMASSYTRGSKSDVIRRLESFIRKARKELGLKAAA